MTQTESVFALDWYAKADDDIHSAAVLLFHDGAVNVAAFLLQQAVERILKGWLLDQGWDLERTHDCVRLLNDAVLLDPEWEAHRDLCHRVSQYYFHARYPLLPGADATSEGLAWELAQVRAVRERVREQSVPHQDELSDQFPA